MKKSFALVAIGLSLSVSVKSQVVLGNSHYNGTSRGGNTYYEGASSSYPLDNNTFTLSAFSRPAFVSKSVSRYYNKIDYGSFDVVINPVVTKPLIQLTYNVAVKYIRKEEQPCCLSEQKK